MPSYGWKQYVEGGGGGGGDLRNRNMGVTPFIGTCITVQMSVYFYATYIQSQITSYNEFAPNKEEN